MTVVRKFSRKSSRPSTTIRHGVLLSRHTRRNVLFSPKCNTGAQLARLRKGLVKRTQKIDQQVSSPIRKESRPRAPSTIPAAPVPLHNTRKVSTLAIPQSGGAPVRRYQLREVLGVLHHQSVSLPQSTRSSRIKANDKNPNIPLFKRLDLVPSADTACEDNSRRYTYRISKPVGSPTNPPTLAAKNLVVQTSFLCAAPQSTSGPSNTRVNQCKRASLQPKQLQAKILPKAHQAIRHMLGQSHSTLARQPSNYAIGNVSASSSSSPSSTAKIRAKPGIQETIERPEEVLNALKESEQARRSEELRLHLLQRAHTPQMPPVLVQRDFPASPSTLRFDQLNISVNPTIRSGTVPEASRKPQLPNFKGARDPMHTPGTYYGHTNPAHQQPHQQKKKRVAPSSPGQVQRKRQKPTDISAVKRAPTGILDLPVELIKMVYGNMVSSDVNCLRHTCRKFYHIFENEKKTIPLTADFSWLRSSVKELESIATNPAVSKHVVKIIFVDIEPISGRILQEKHPNLPAEHVRGYNMEKSSIVSYHEKADTSQHIRRILNKFRNLRLLEYHAGYLSPPSPASNTEITLQQALSPDYINEANQNMAYQKRLRACGGRLFQTPTHDWAEASRRNFHRMISYVLDNRHRSGPLDVKITTSHYCGLGSGPRCKQRFAPHRVNALRSLEICYRGEWLLPGSRDWFTMANRGNGTQALSPTGPQFDGVEELTLVGNPKDEDHFMVLSPDRNPDQTFKLLLPNLKKLTLVNVIIDDAFMDWARGRPVDIVLRNAVVKGGGMRVLNGDSTLRHIKTIACVSRTQAAQSQMEPLAREQTPPISPDVALQQMVRARHENNKRMVSGPTEGVQAG
ncbi:uncharacterized protein EI97DRAFT_470859 [Westerdykella ornata]|uniref:F-box domain-containing protein n=1 Tax=Westerdykella ornata TaxID=318751 RepID=A0A6A6J9G0_WESOR|nr:uncharacterized protein EI97DRAFT_470859 [Westerdykella ornata]KAF2271869.1 hypothetical protein EI97DRAFT_470859 [Westerdykella ornata]